MKKGEILAKVAGSSVYNLRIRIQTLSGKKWNVIKGRCAGEVGSLLELLQGKLSHHVMQVVTDRREGLFPLPGEISLHCDCPDWAVMCKHVAAVLYGVAARLDQTPELLFTLRGVDQHELIAAADAAAAVSAATSRSKSKRLADGELSDVFGIDLDTSDHAEIPSPPRKKRSSQTKMGAARKKKAKKTPTKHPSRKPSQKVSQQATKQKAGSKTAVKKSATQKGLQRSAGPTTKKKVAKKVAKKAASPRTAVKKSTTQKGLQKSAGPKTKKKVANARKLAQKVAKKAAKKKTPAAKAARKSR
ncbi:MAG: hypothetical protein GTO53_06610 [Planctomycetales bacterium]|nr:hypothetical protein [Planctomycetales bacterium]NIM08811.1 hypothetical protein [Planctomycetales bacterium]NIN07741.1 hypothetical protein [Planctomycetales bacterium]NIO34576.1 hypothetical protein [Planctomycetales bacterium]NIO46374.1 hypothetical protein [Planctomycetales bacterium]